MASKTDFTSAEWEQLLKAPLWASMIVVAASPSGPLGVVKELFAAGKVLAETRSGTQTPLVSVLVADLPLPQAHRMAAHFGQIAFLWCDASGMPRLHLAAID
jgi:hypothetical protein